MNISVLEKASRFVKNLMPTCLLNFLIVYEAAQTYQNLILSFQSTSSVFTFTNSTVMHPDDMTSVTHSLPPSQMSTRATNSCATTANPTPISGVYNNSLQFSEVYLGYDM